MSSLSINHLVENRLTNKRYSDEVAFIVMHTSTNVLNLKIAAVLPTSPPFIVQSVPSRNNERRLAIMEIRMLGWTNGDYDYIRRPYGVTSIVEKLRDGHSRWYGHVIRIDENSDSETNKTSAITTMA